MSNPPSQRRLPVLVNLNTQERHPLNGPSWTLGRAPESSIILADDGYASASHARIYWEQGWWIEDLNSSNGTVVNEQLIKEPCRLSPQDVIKLGRTFFRIE